MTKEDLIEYIEGEYGIKSDKPFEKHPDITIFRHQDNRKWFAILITVGAKYFGRKTDEDVWSLGVKCDTLLKSSFLSQKGVYPAYHMNKEHWLTLCLDEIDDNDLKTLIDISFDLTKKKYKKTKSA